MAQLVQFRPPSMLNDVLTEMGQKQDAQRSEDARRMQLLMQAYMKDPIQAEALRQSNPQMFAGFNAPSETPEISNRRGMDQIQAALVAAARGAQEKGIPFNPDPIVMALVNQNLGGQQPLMNITAQRFNYTNPSNLPAEVVRSQKIADKLAEGEPDRLTREQQNNQFQQGFMLDSQKTAAQVAADRARASAENASAGLSRAKTNQITSLMGDGEGGVSPQVANVVHMAISAASNGADPDAIIKRATAKDPMLEKAVRNELSRPENQSVLMQSPMAQKQRDTLAELDPLIQQADAAIAALEPYKNKNGLTDRMTMDYLLYRAGKKPSDNSPAAQLANLQMLGVQAGSRLLKGGSRAYQALQMAMQHAPDGAIDTYANAYDKAIKLRKQLQNVRDANVRFGGQITQQGAANGPAGGDSNPDPLGILH